MQNARAAQPDHKADTSMRESTEAGQTLTPRARTFVIYIDGYNLYKAIDHPATLKLGWCNYKLLASELAKLSFGASLRAGEEDAVIVKYFTALVRQKSLNPKENTGGHKGEEDRQRLWLETLKAKTGVEPIRGLHLRDGDFHREKMTDVNIALTMMEDAQVLRPAGIVLVSGDLDLCPAVAKVVRAGIPVAVFNPDEHPNYSLPMDTFSGGERAGNLFEMRHLGKDLMQRCGLGCESEWIRYLEMKAESYRPPKNPEYFLKYGALVEAEKRSQKNRRRPAP